MNIISQEEIQRAKKELEVIRATINQLKKDFQLFDEEIHISSDQELAYSTVLQQTQIIIDRMLNLDTGRFFSFLYTVDLDEKLIHQLLLGSSKLDATTEISRLILERELLKVLSRRHFSANDNSSE